MGPQVMWWFQGKFVQGNCSCRCSVQVKNLNSNTELDIGSGMLLERTSKFCYLGDTLERDGECSAVMARISSVWEKFQAYLPMLTGKGSSLKLKWWCLLLLTTILLLYFGTYWNCPLCNFCMLSLKSVGVMSGNQEWDGHTRAWLGTVAAVTGTRQDYPACAFKRSKDKRHWIRPPFHCQRPVYLPIVSSKNPDR